MYARLVYIKYRLENLLSLENLLFARTGSFEFIEIAFVDKFIEITYKYGMFAFVCYYTGR
jgi:hypothetical protein